MCHITCWQTSASSAVLVGHLPSLELFCMESRLSLPSDLSGCHPLSFGSRPALRSPRVPVHIALLDPLDRAALAFSLSAQQQSVLHRSPRNMSDNGEGPSGARPRAVPMSEAPHGGSPLQESSSPRALATARVGSPGTSFQAGSPSVRQVPVPAQLTARESSQPATPLPGVGEPSSPPMKPGESALSSALRATGRGASPRSSSPPVRSLSPSGLAPLSGCEPDNGGSPLPYEDAEIIRRHLAGPRSSSPGGSGFHQGSPSRTHMVSGDDSEPPRPGADAEDEGEFSSLRLQGGDITRQIYRWSQQQDAGEQRMKRSRSLHSTRPRAKDDALNIDSIKQPGGFRRNYLRRAVATPSPHPQEDYGTMEQGPPQHQQPFTSNFLEFLTLYGHFAGESLEEDDEVLGPDEYFSSEAGDEADGRSEGEDREFGESSGLLSQGKRRKKRKDKSAGKATPTGAALLLLKSFVGTGVLFLPRAFLNGGMVFSNVVLLGVAALSYYCFVLLVTTRLRVEHSFGDMGLALYGRWLRNLINFSLVISQIGFSSAYIVFVSENLQAFVLAVSGCRVHIPIQYMILMQLIIFLPLSLYRNINHIQKLALVADVFILLGLVYLYYFDLATMVRQHGAADIVNLNAKDWTLFVGTAIFTFEGIGLIIPIQTGMRDPARFPGVLGGVMIIITIVFVSMGALSYAAFGSATKTVVLLNLPQDDKFVNGVQFIYSVAILLSTPLQIYPAIEITSQQLFSRTGKFNPYIKWKKNVFRFVMVMVCALLAWAGADDLDKFVSLVGSFACIPLVFIYPVSAPALHRARLRAPSLTTSSRCCISRPWRGRRARARPTWRCVCLGWWAWRTRRRSRCAAGCRAARSRRRGTATSHVVCLLLYFLLSRCTA